MKKAFRTTFQENILKEMKKTAIDLGCNVNELLEISYNHLISNWNNKEISNFMASNKKKEDK